MTGLAPCSEYSEEVDLDQVLTPPEAGANLDPVVSQNGVEAKWDSYSVLSCIRYGVSDKSGR